MENQENPVPTEFDIKISDLASRFVSICGFYKANDDSGLGFEKLVFETYIQCHMVLSSCTVLVDMLGEKTGLDMDDYKNRLLKDMESKLLAFETKFNVTVSKEGVFINAAGSH